jgi:DNA-binding transcriptional ArsR family regulator
LFNYFTVASAIDLAMIEKTDNQQPVTFPRLEKTDHEQRAKVFAALSDPTRLQIVDLLVSCDEMSGSEIANQLEISLALFCHHSKTLVEAGLVQSRKDGQTRYNSLNRALLSACLTSFPGLM